MLHIFTCHSRGDSDEGSRTSVKRGPFLRTIETPAKFCLVRSAGKTHLEAISQRELTTRRGHRDLGVSYGVEKLFELISIESEFIPAAVAIEPSRGIAGSCREMN